MTSAHLILPKYERAIPAWTGSGGNTYLWTTNSVSSVPISQQCPETPPPTYHINPRAPMDNFTAVQGPINHLQVCDLPFRLLVGLWCFFFFCGDSVLSPFDCLHDLENNSKTKIYDSRLWARAGTFHAQVPHGVNTFGDGEIAQPLCGPPSAPRPGGNPHVIGIHSRLLVPSHYGSWF